MTQTQDSWEEVVDDQKQQPSSHVELAGQLVQQRYLDDVEEAFEAQQMGVMKDVEEEQWKEGVGERMRKKQTWFYLHYQWS